MIPETEPLNYENFSPTVMIQLVQAGILTVNEVRRAWKLPPREFQQAGEKVLYNGPTAAVEAPPVEVREEPAPQAPKTVYRPTTPPKRGAPRGPRPSWTSKFPPSDKQIGMLKYLVRDSGFSIADLDAMAIEEARAAGGADSKFVTGWYAMSGKIASRMIGRLQQEELPVAELHVGELDEPDPQF